MPRWYRRLLNNYEQRATDVQIWKAFRRRDRFVEIASDGGLSNAVGTFGWKIVTILPTKHELTLFQGSGFIDGPIEVGSSTRSELGGFTAPLFLATALARFWGIRHRGQFRWFTDSTSAISKVRMFSTKGRPRHFPDNSDYVMVIRDLLRELKRPITSTWVKGHQDDDKPYNELSREARLNVDVDELATNHTIHQMHVRPMRRIDHIPSQLISLKINGQRFPSHWDSNLRWTINGSYMKTYVKEKHGWDETTWNTIDFVFVKAYCKTASSGVKHKWFKFMHNLQSTGERKQKMNGKGDDVNISQCPCCTRQLETQQHMLLCELNPKRTEALMELSTGGSGYKEHHNFTRAMTECIEQWIHDPTTTPSPDNFVHPATPARQESLLPLHMEIILQEAIQEQNKLGWMNLLRGYISNKWIILASSHMLNAKAQLQKSEGRRRLGVILQRIQLFVTKMWTGRNEMLHRRDKDDEAKFVSLEAAEIRHYFSQPHLLPVSNQHYCTGSVLQILRSSPANRRRWLMRVRRARAETLNDQLRQVRITSFFSRKSHDQISHNNMASRSTATDSRIYTERRIQATSNHRPVRPVQTQTRIHHFFPGRPPETHATGQSHSSKSLASK